MTRNRLIRKSIHLLTGLAILLLSFWIEKKTLFFIILTGSVFAFATYNYSRFSLLHKTADASLGTLFYPLGVITAFLLLYNKPIQFFQISLLILTVSDTAANITGQFRPGNIYFNAFREEKSLYGVLGFGLTALLIFRMLLPESDFGLSAYILLAILLAITFEVVSYKGSDNFSIPVGSALFFLIMDHFEGNLLFLILVLILSAAASWFFYYRGVLTKNGSLVMYFMGLYFLGVLGWTWTLPLLAFFVSSVLLTALHTYQQKKKRSDNRRNAWQVLANGLGAILFSAGFLLLGDPLMIYFFISVVAAVTADTWASEVGPVFHKRCFSLSDFRMRASGVSGGISPAGSLAALVGSFTIVILAAVLFNLSGEPYLLIALGLSGFFASFTDTFLGAFVEKKLETLAFFREHKHKESLSPNDVVNIAGSMSAAVFFIFFMMMMGNSNF